MVSSIYIGNNFRGSFNWGVSDWSVSSDRSKSVVQRGKKVQEDETLSQAVYSAFMKMFSWVEVESVVLYSTQSVDQRGKMNVGG